MKNRLLKQTKNINIFDIIRVFVIILFTLFAAYPFIYTLVGSFNDGLDYAYGGVWLYPRVFTFANYQVVLSDTRLYTALFNTAAITILGTIGGLLFTSCVAYAMSSNKLRGKKFFWMFNLITMFFGGGIIPYYMVILFTGLYNSFLVYIIPTLYSVFNMIILTNFFKSIDIAMREAAMIDGANEFRIWWSIYMPVSKPALATIAMWLILGRWNTYMATLLFTDRDQSLWTLQFYLMRIIRDSSMPSIDGALLEQVSGQTITFAAIVVAIVPMACMYPILSKYFSKGLMIGSLKG